MSLGNIMRGQFDLFYQLVGNVPLVRNTTEIIDTYVFRAATETFDISRGMRLQELEAVSQKMRQPENKRGPEGEEKDTQGQRHQVGKHCQGHSFHRNFCQP